jgi:hypothetical protein
LDLKLLIQESVFSGKKIFQPAELVLHAPARGLFAGSLLKSREEDSESAQALMWKLSGAMPSPRLIVTNSATPSPATILRNRWRCEKIDVIFKIISVRKVKVVQQIHS